MKILWILLAVQTLNHAPTNAEDKAVARKCCNNDKNLIIGSKCIPDKTGKSFPIDLKCKDSYVLDPNLFEEDHYNVTSNGSLHVFDFESAIPPNEFCIVNQNVDDESEINEIAIVCIDTSQMDINFSKLTFVVKAILLLVSVIFLLLTLYIYFRLSELRETQDKVTIFTLINLTTFLAFLGILQVQHPTDIIGSNCVSLAFIVYYFTMGYFAWLNCVIANLWKIVVLRHWKVPERHWYLMNHIYGWTVPSVMTVIVASQHFIKPSIGVSMCWFHSERDQWVLVYLPISIMLALNVFLSLWTSLSLINSDFSPDARKALKYKCILYVKLFLLGGFTWIFEVLSYTFNNHAPSAWLWMIVDSLNCLHGLLTFFVLIVWRQRIRKELAGKRILCFLSPSRWADVDDEEQICLDNEGKGKYDLIIKTLK